MTPAPDLPNPSGYSCNGKAATIVGTKKGEAINGTAGDDVIVALDGNDTIYGGGGNDTVCARCRRRQGLRRGGQRLRPRRELRRHAERR